MADLGNLWFSLGLDDTKFEKEWRAAFNKYKNDAKIDVSFQLDKSSTQQLDDFQKKLTAFTTNFNNSTKGKIDIEITPNTLKALDSLRNLGGTKGEWAAVKELAKTMREVVKTANQYNKAQEKMEAGNKRIAAGYRNQSLWLQNLSTLASNYFSLYAVKNFVTELARVSGEFEKQRVTLQAMVGEMEGLEIYSKMKQLAVVSPFEFKDLASYAKQLAAFSVPYEELYDTTKRLADISAGLGVDMSRIILAYGQIRSAGVLRGAELRQLTEAGVPILDKLAKKFEELEGRAVSVGDVFGRISQRMVSFEMVKDIFTELTSEGGKFYNMQEIQAETLSGKISNLKDAYSIMLSEIGESSEGALKGGVEWLYKLINNWEDIGVAVMSAVVAYGAYQTAQALAFARDKLRLIILFTQEFIKLGGSIRKAAASLAAMNVATKSGVYGVLAGALFGIGAALISAYYNARKFNKEMAKIINTESNNLQNEISALDNLTRAIGNTTEGTENRRKAIEAYNNRFGQYLGNLYDEKTALDAIRKGNEEVKAAMSDRYKEEAKLKAELKVKEEYGGALTTAETDYRKSLQKIGLGGYASSAIAIIQDELKKSPTANFNDIRVAFFDAFKDLDLNITQQLLNSFQGVFGDYQKDFVTFVDAMKTALQDVDDTFNLSIYNSWKKEEEYKRLTEEYNKELKNIEDSTEPGSDELQEGKEKARIAYLKNLIELYKDLPRTLKPYEEELKRIIDTTRTWQDEAVDVFKSKGAAEGFAPTDQDSFLGYLDKMREDYKDITKQLKDLQKVDFNNVKPGLEARVAAYEALAKLWGVSLDEKTSRKAATDAQKKELNNLKDRYNWILKISEAYNKLLKQDATPEIAKSAVASTFKDVPKEIVDALKGNADWTAWFVDEFSRIADEAGKIGSDAGDDFKNALLQRLGTTDVKEVIEALRLGEEIKKELENWGLGDFALTGEGVTLDISKALKEQTVADNEAFARRKEILDKIAKAEKGDAAEIAALKKMYGDKWLEEAKARANELYELEVANNRKIAEDKIKEMGKAYAKESREVEFSPDFFSSLGEKTLTQLENASNKLKEMINSPAFLMDEDYLDKIASGELSQDQIDEHIKQWRIYFDLLRSDVDIQHFEKVKKRLVESGKALSNVIDSVKELADADSVLGGLLDGLGVAVDAATTIADSFERTTKTNKETGAVTELTEINWTNMAAAALQVAAAVVKNIFAAKQYREEMERAADAFQQSIDSSRRELKIAGEEFETIFGENLISAFEADSKAISDIVRELKNATSSVSNMKIMTRKGFFGIGKKYTTLKDLAPQLFKADGSVNYEYLDEFLDAYGDKISESQKTLLEHLKSTYEQYQDAMADTNDYLSGIFSDTANTIADRMLEAFATTGDAATDLGDLVSDVAKQMAKDLIQSILLEQYLQPYMDRIKNLYNPLNKEYEDDPALRIQKAISAYQEGLAAISVGANEFNKIFQGISDMGIDLSSGAENASEVLSGLSEDQQNLLVSYINGIRADVSMNRGLLTSVVNSVGAINNNIATAIVVWKQIEANTHRSADGVDRIIGFFESVMGPYDGGAGQAFQVNIA